MSGQSTPESAAPPASILLRSRCVGGVSSHLARKLLIGTDPKTDLAHAIADSAKQGRKTTLAMVKHGEEPHCVTLPSVT